MIASMEVFLPGWIFNQPGEDMMPVTTNDDADDYP